MPKPHGVTVEELLAELEKQDVPEEMKERLSRLIKSMFDNISGAKAPDQSSD